jgi:hypothetical protein
VSSNPGITMEDVQANPDYPWDIIGLSKNPNLTIDYIVRNYDKYWDWFGVVCNPNIMLEDILTHINLPLRQLYLTWNSLTSIISAYNPNITMKFIDQNPHTWVDSIRNPLTREKHRFYREHMAAYHIQSKWHIASTNPEYRLCKSRLEKAIRAMSF